MSQSLDEYWAFVHATAKRVAARPEWARGAIDRPANVNVNTMNNDIVRRTTCPIQLPSKVWVMTDPRRPYYGLLVDVVDIGHGQVLAAFEKPGLCREYVACRPIDLMVKA